MTFPRQFIEGMIFLAIVIMAVASCTVVPAKLERIQTAASPGCPLYSESIYNLLEFSLEQPNEGESAHALAHFVEEWRKQRGGEIRGSVGPEKGYCEGGPVYKVQFSKPATGGFFPGYFDEISPARDFQVKKIPQYQREGFGAALVAMRQNTGREPIERFYPPEGISRVVTAVIHSQPNRQVRIELMSPLTHETVRVGGKTRPLMADFSVSWAALLERSGDLNRSELGDMLRRTPRRDPQLYLMEEYDPQKEPLIMIHGLLASPLAWAKMNNELRNDEKIRARYQIWHFLYNTSAPALYPGRILRAQLREIRSVLDPGQNDRAMQRTTLLTHSMGGIVARGLITDPGEAFWDRGFTRPLSSLNLGEGDRERLREAFYWKPEPYVRRVIFVCTPHRGSDYADNPLGKLGQLLVKPPSKFREFYERISAANPGAFTPEYEELGSGRLDSVGALSPEQPTLQILSDLPVPYPVVMHSIIGNRGKKGPLEDSSDGIVPYWSSHIEEAASEKIVPTGHGAIDERETVEEVIRILHLPR
jgi:pimeloyl-ACP methyl ester carboxylesterase